MRLPWRRDPEIARLTIEINALQLEACRRSADEVVEIGRRLREAQARLENGEWMDWIENAVPFKHSTALKYIRVAKLARDDPDGFARLRHLGPSKLHVLAFLTPARRRELPLARPLPVGGNRRKSAEIMTVDELAIFVKDPPLPPSRKPPFREFVKDYRSQLTDVLDATLEFVANKKEVSLGLARKVHRQAVKIVAALEDGFGF